MTKEQKAVYDYLNTLKIDYTIREHEPVWTAADCIAEGKEKNAFLCKNLFLTNAKKDRFYLFMLQEKKRMDGKALADQLKETRLSFAGEDKLWSYLKVKQGAVSPMALLFDRGRKVQLVVDKDIFLYREVVCHPCINTATIMLKVDDLINCYLPATEHTVKIVETADI